MAIPEYRNPVPERIGAEIVSRLSALRSDIGALRQEILESNQDPPALNDESYRLATKIDLLVNRYLRLRKPLDAHSLNP